MATSTVEDYLKQIELEEQRAPGSRVSTGTLATALGVTPGSVTAMVQALAESGLVDYEAYAGTALTPAGRRVALHVLRRHRLVELFLVTVLGFDWSEVHEEAERLEHAISDRVVERLDELLGYPEVDPHGDPIPSAGGELARASQSALDTVEIGVRTRLARVADQDPEFLRLLERLGIRPGTRLKVVARDRAADSVELDLGRSRRATLGLRAAEKLYVETV